LDRAREAVAHLVDAPSEDIAFVPNASTGVNTIVSSLTFGPGDELFTNNHEYGPCNNALRRAAARSGAKLVVADVPSPLAHKALVKDTILAQVNERTRLVLLSHVTSPTGLVFPIEDIMPVLRARGILVMIDGAHAPGMLPLSMRTLDPDFYTGNF